MLTQDDQKRRAAHAALEYIEYGSVLGIGSGSTVNIFIEELKAIKGKLDGVIPASNDSLARLRALSIPIVDLNSTPDLPLYIDSADEINHAKQMVKGGGAALTKEKIIATVAKKFICIADQRKEVELLGAFPVAVEVIPLARSYVAREIIKLGGDPVYRQGVVTDNGNHIIDVHNLKILNPIEMEAKLDAIVGVVCNGIFAKRPADVVLLATSDGVKKF